MIHDYVNDLLKSYEVKFGYTIRLSYCTSTKMFYVENNLEIRTEDGCLKGIAEHREDPTAAIMAFSVAVTNAKHYNTLVVK